jgi:hypothetical protein
MAGNRLDMKDIEEIKRLWKMGLTNRQIAKASGGKIHRAGAGFQRVHFHRSAGPQWLTITGFHRAHGVADIGWPWPSSD